MAAREITFVEAIREAIREEMLRDQTVFIMGEDIQYGLFGATKNLIEEFGPERVRPTPISEAGFVGAGIGAAATGTRPIVEVMFSDFLTVCFDQIVNQAAKMRYMFGGKLKLPLVIRCATGGGLSSAAQHSQSPYAWLVHTPGLKVALPSTPYDAKGLLKTAIRSDDPVVFFEHKVCYRVKGHVPEEDYTVPFGVADVKRRGSDVTIVATALMVHRSLAAAEKLQGEGVSVEVVDPRTLTPLDRKTIIESVRKTGKLVVVDEGVKAAGFSAEVAAVVVEEAIEHLDAPIRRVANPGVPIPFSPVLERYVIPDEDRILTAVREIAG